MLAHGGIDTLMTSLEGARSRSYFGIYTVRDYPERQLRTIAHGTTLHGQQSTDPARSREPMSYYGPTSGAGLGLAQAQPLYGQAARVGVVGLGAGSLACVRRPGEHWVFFEIDPVVLEYSRNGTFTYVSQCTPDAKVVIGDARIELARMPAASFDVLAVDAFSSDAIPLHLLTDEAFGVYFDALAPRGLLLVHISNRFIELEPVLAAIARKRGLALVKRDDIPEDRVALTPSTWVALSRDPAIIERLKRASPQAPWSPLLPPASRVWSDDHASILPSVRWENMTKVPQ
jgi:SAM-dependent methyltransferase